MENQNSQENPQLTTIGTGAEKLDDVIALTNLVNIIVDYYSFKINVEEEDESDKWKKGESEPKVVPVKIDSLIEKAFSSQLKKFSDLKEIK